MGMKNTTSKTAIKRRVLASLLAGAALFAVTDRAEAQEILLTGPLAGAPAVREMRLYREGRFELAPAVSFTLLDEYQRTILLGARLNYNLTDWLSIGVWGAYGGLLQLPTALSDHIQDVNARRKEEAAAAPPDDPPLDHELTKNNIGQDFTDQLASLDWVVAPQITAVPFRGKLALFESIYLDTDLYLFAGPAFVGLQEREECTLNCDSAFNQTSRVAIAPTFGLGFTFYMNDWSALGFEWRGLPFSWNPAGFDTAGGGEDNRFPDNQITADDRQFRFNQMLTVSYNIYLPTEVRISE